ncbi:MAG TPA: acyltransferase domain-containing protein, partial [Candidatus Thermoplasmatota archaeon]|nr:acyltransferase domain-containing protein [Candidatus Thermoplasmatota archaeon]
LEASPFFVNTKPHPWPRGAQPRRAGVSSFGIGGTNAHVVLEEAPHPAAASTPAEARPQLLLLSARTPTALDASASALADHLEANPGVTLQEAAFTLQVGRRRFPHRRALLADTREEALALLRGTGNARRAFAQAGDVRERAVAFLLPGQGAQHVNMGRGLYDQEPAFRAEVDRCATLLQPHLGEDLRAILYPAPGAEAEAARKLAETRYTQPALFVVSYALARTWMRWGVRPRALLGHSLGEYVAATLAGVMRLEDALALVAARGTLMQELPPGAMVSVAATEETVRALLPEGLAVAAVNAASAVVVSGEPSAVARFAETLAARGIETRPLPVQRAFHSAMLDPILGRFEQVVRGLQLSAPRVPVVSNLTGTWLTAEEATSPAYWVNHLRQAVRFADGLGTLLQDQGLALLEVGPGRTLSSLASRHAARARDQPVLASMRHAEDAATTDAAALREALARLWLAGATPDWRAVHAPSRPRLARLPAYPFERRRYWLDPLPLPWERASAATSAVAAGSASEEPVVRVPVVMKDAAPRHERPDHLPTVYAPPRNPLEETLVVLWEDLFGFKGVGIHDDFFDLGGHSLLATRLVARVRETFEVEVTLPDLFAARTVQDLAAVVEAALLRKLESLTEEEAQRALDAR